MRIGQNRSSVSSTVFSIGVLLVAMTSMQSGAALAKHLFPVLGAQGTAAVRVAISALMLSAIWRPWRFKVTRPQLRILWIYGASLGLMNLTFYSALERIPLGIAVALEFPGPLAVALISARKRLDFLWAVLAAIGIFLILPLTEASAALDPIGIFFALAAGAFWGLYILFGQKAGGSVHGGAATTVGMLMAAIVVCPFGIAQAGSTLIDPTLFPAALGLAILSGALPYSLEMIVLKRIPAQTFGIFMSLAPAMGALSGLIFLNERLTAIQWLAIFLVVLASVGTSIQGKEKTIALEPIAGS